MKYLDLTLPTHAENHACDEALLDACEAGEGAVLRVYEPASTCIIVGYGNRVAVEVDVDACAAARVPILRRLSGGGTVALGPGCLAYALALPVEAPPDLATVTGANRHIMHRIRGALQKRVPGELRVQGHTDLTLGDLKVSGNAQRRRGRALLFHGTLLLHFDLPLIERLLRQPSAEPDYRRGRRHGDFVTNLGIET